MAKKPTKKPSAKAKKPASKKAAPAKKAGAAKSKSAAKPKAKSKPAAKPAKGKAKPAAKAPVRSGVKPAPKAKVVAKSRPTESSGRASKPVAKSASKPVASKPAVSNVKVALSRPVAHIAKKSNLPEDNRSRYSDAELKEFKTLIHKKLEEATRDYELLKNTLSHKDDHGTDDTSPTFKLLEDGSDVLSKEETAHLAARQEKYIQNLKNALIRIENKTYGICRVTGKLIPKERLRSVPHATLSIDAKLGQNR
jgi:RNA polymerase-binding transcription factor DksA